MPSTLNQLLASQQGLHAHCLIELREDGGAVHRVHLRGGMVQAVELASQGLRFGEVLAEEISLPRTLLDHASRAALVRRRRIGEVLVASGLISLRARDGVLDRQRILRLRQLVGLRHVRILVRPAAPLPPGASELLPVASQSARAAALALLGLGPGATAAEIVTSYRRLVRSLHPDHRGPTDATEPEPAEALCAVLEAYRVLSSE